MSKFITLFSLLVLSFSANSYAQPAVLARWNFEVLDFSAATGTSFTPSAGTVVADSGAVVTGSVVSGFHAAAATAWTTPTGNGSSNAASANNWASGDYWQFQVTGTGYSGLHISFDVTSSNTGPKSFLVQYSTNGTTFTDVPASAFDVTNDSWSSVTFKPVSNKSFDLSSITALNNQATVYFRVTVAPGSLAVNGSAIASTGTSRIDNFSVANYNTLPLRLNGFKASFNNGAAALTWNTSNEVNVQGFEVERSTDARNFVKVGTVAALNNSVANYQFSDVTVASGVNYYRLKMIDKDGSYSFSGTLSLIGKSFNSIGVYPNPVKGSAIITHTKAEEGARLRITNANGQIVANHPLQLGATQTALTTENLLAGIYIISIENKAFQQSIRFVKQ
jgi:hypothetical protein